MNSITSEINSEQDKVLHNLNLASLENGIADEQLIYEAAVVISSGKICWQGPMKELPKPYQQLEKVDCHGQWLLPGLIDCHTHLVFGGDRADEFEKRLQGVSYEEIARAGGGIMNTVGATRDADFDHLYQLAQKRLQAMQQQGVTTIEIKSGYGLNTESELKMLRVARKLKENSQANIQATFLGAHALPPEFKDNSDGYIDLVCNDMLPKVAQENLADAADVFCEGIGFNLGQSHKVLFKAQSLGLKVKAHVEQLSNLGGSEMAAGLKALSVDHIEYLDEQGVAAIAQSGTVATLLPGAFYFLRETQCPPIELLRQHKVPIAIATDFNPGSSPIASLPLMLNMACTFFRLTPEEALLGVTKHAAGALGLQDKIGTISVGKQADLTLWDIGHPRELCYFAGLHKPSQVWFKGQLLGQV
ncbi:imidazolonepropionase [Planctobacterium marinum]|uniref:imidazolonepropionase n=1 Tax=Planctobacterium marinum TaxID=1631968 RepID=UPI001E4AF160|nr:imidazolonepropionase [Planctobacterium marinum]MCC2607594.1 imidazolonepropionase [Planctobacterium marinum]